MSSIAERFLPSVLKNCDIEININNFHEEQAVIEIVSDRISDWYANYITENESLKTEFKIGLKKAIRLLLSLGKDPDKVELEMGKTPKELGVLDILVTRYAIKNPHLIFPQDSLTKISYWHSKKIKVFVQTGLPS
ncbi:MAG: hypothetical protein WC222_01680 [Parachlamydiales bacterium]|jgi:hypothetical protein